MAEYELALYNPTGAVRLATLSNWTKLTWSRAVNAVGQFSLTFNLEDFDRSMFGLDRRLFVWRKAEGGVNRLVRSYFLRYIGRGYRDGVAVATIAGPCANDLLARRIVAYDEGTAQADKSDQADDMIKDYLYDNLGAGAVAGRDMSGYSLSDAADLADGPSIDKEASYRSLLAVAQEICETAEPLGTRVYFDIVETAAGALELRTYTGQRGMDRRYGQSKNQMLFSLERGNLLDPWLEQDWREEINCVYALGPGIEGIRDVVEVSDATRIAASIWNRREGTSYAASSDDSNIVEDEGNARLHEGRPRRNFYATLLETPQCRYQRDWDFGDRVTAEFENERYDCEIAALSGEIAGQKETITARLEYAE